MVNAQARERGDRACSLTAFPGVPLNWNPLSNSNNGIASLEILHDDEYPFPVSADDLRATGFSDWRHKGMGQAIVRRLLLTALPRTTALSPLPDGQALASLRTDGYRYGL